MLVSTGAKQSCYNACLALLDPGDEAIVVAPYWVSYPDMVRLAEAEPVIVATSAERGFKMTAEQLAGALTPKTRLLILNSPCNPTGAVYSAAELRALGDVLRAHPRVVVLSDEIYEHIQWTGRELASFAAVCPDLYDRTLTVNGMSKGYAMSGWRIGYAAGPVARHQSDDEPARPEHDERLHDLAGGRARGARRRTRAACATCAPSSSGATISSSRACARLPGFDCVPADGTFYLFPNVEAAMRAKGVATDVELCERLIDEAGVALVPGTAFGAPGHLRFSFAASTSTLEAALARLDNFFAR